jgi:flagellar biosynthetic protein FlhB
MSPASKLKQMFSPTGLSGVLKSLLPFSAIVYVAYVTGRNHWAQIMEASLIGFGALVRLIGSLLFEIGWKAGMVMLLWAGIDYFLTWRKMETDLKMSNQDVRDELKDTEGNPAIKGRMRRLRRRMRNRQMLKDVPKATVVVTNPTHFAVAIQYEPHMAAPIVLAKGRDFLAEKIKDLARWNQIPILENKPLAQALFRLVEVGQTIPAALYAAVAEILAFVFHAQARARSAASRTHARLPRPAVNPPAYAGSGVTP